MTSRPRAILVVMVAMLAIPVTLAATFAAPVSVAAAASATAAVVVGVLSEVVLRVVVRVGQRRRAPLASAAFALGAVLPSLLVFLAALLGFLFLLRLEVAAWNRLEELVRDVLRAV